MTAKEVRVHTNNVSDNLNSTLSSPFECNNGTARSKKEIQDIAILFLFVLTTAIGVIGNALVCAVLKKFSRKSTMDFFILMLAVADLGILLVEVPLILMRIQLNGEWPLGELACQFFYPTQDLYYGVSIWTIVVIAVERYRSIVSLTRGCRRRSLRSSRFVTLAIWVFNFCIFSLPLFFLMKYTQICEVGYCQVVWPEWSEITGQSNITLQIHTALIVLVGYVIPLTIIVWTYVVISKHLETSNLFLEQGSGLGSPGAARDKMEGGARDKIEAEARAKAEAKARDKTEAGTREKIEAGTREKIEAGTMDKIEAGAKDKIEAGAKDKIEAEARAKAEAGARDKTEAGARDKTEAGTREKIEAGTSEKIQAGAMDKIEAGAKDKAEAGARHKIVAGKRSVQLRIKQNIRAKRLLTPVVIVFAVTMLPLNIFRFVVLYVVVPNEYFRFIFPLACFLVAINSVVNPAIYSITSERFRKGLKALFVRSMVFPRNGVFTYNAPSQANTNSTEENTRL